MEGLVKKGRAGVIVRRDGCFSAGSLDDPRRQLTPNPVRSTRHVALSWQVEAALLVIRSSLPFQEKDKEEVVVEVRGAKANEETGCGREHCSLPQQSIKLPSPELRTEALPGQR